MTLREKIYAASERNGTESRIQAVADLKSLILDKDHALDLCTLLKDDLYPAERTVVAQVLGFHKASTRFLEVGAVLFQQAEKEKDVIALRALVFSLQGCDGVTAFLDHRDEEVVLEAVLNAPTNTPSLQALLHTAFDGLPDVAFEAMCRRLKTFKEIVPHVVAFLMTAKFKELGQAFDGRVKRIFKALPQVVLFEALVDVRGDLERSYKTIWPGIWERERQRKLLELFVEMVGEQGVDDLLAEVVLHRLVVQEEAYEQYVRFVRALLGVFNTRMALGWIVACDHLGQKADRALLSRLAETLVSLVRSTPLVVEEVQAVLAKWEPQLPGVRMKAIHAAR